jgi:glycosyltransferase involved in cell wall biosynthesis
MTIAAIIPARNAELTVGAAVESARHQERRPDRVLVVDDGSTDATAAVAESAGAVVIRRDRQGGPAAARNDGLRACGTRWAAFLDADDVWLPGHLARAGDAVQTDPPVLAAASALRVDRHGRPLGRTVARAPGETALTALLRGRLTITASAAIVDVSAALALGGFDERIPIPSCEDLDLWLRLAAAGNVVTLEEPGAIYRVAEPAVMKERVDALAAWRIRSVENCLTRIGADGSLIRDARVWVDLDLAASYLKAGRRTDARAAARRALRRSPTRLRGWGLIVLSLGPDGWGRAARAVKRRAHVVAINMGWDVHRFPKARS